MTGIAIRLLLIALPQGWDSAAPAPPPTSGLSPARLTHPERAAAPGQSGRIMASGQ